MKEEEVLYRFHDTELLAPAGSLSCALAAFDAGADAVYAGLKKFNARERTENFTAEEMSKLIFYAKKHGRKVYLTFNTLVKESELPEAAEEIAFLNTLHPDALIVQDIGILRLIREYFPGLCIHASTQMGLHNSAGFQTAADLGISRVILERQSSLPEIRAMMQKKPSSVELELFIHGALCCSLSGTCLLSSWLGGWSGNRGKCKQPCRRRHHSEEGNGFFLSTQDLCTIEILPDIVNTGVRALKIEGRLRRADYVAAAVSAYRMVLNAKTKEEFREVLPAAKEQLARTCGRKWSLGYYTPDSRKTLLKYDSLGASGLLAGKVVRVRDNGFELSAARPLRVGDMLRVQPRSGDEGPSFRLTRMLKDRTPVNFLRRGETAFVLTDRPVEKEAFVYKIGEDVQDLSARIAAMPPMPELLDLQIHFSRKLFRAEVRIPGTGSVCVRWEKTVDLPEAGKRPFSPEEAVRALRETSFGSFFPGKISCTAEGNPFLPASVFKGIRNELKEFLNRELTLEKIRTLKPDPLAVFRKEYASGRSPDFSPLPDSVVLPRNKRYPGRNAVIVREISEKPSPHEELLLPYYLPERSLGEVRKAVEEFLHRGGKNIRITSLCQLSLVKDLKNVILKSCMPLPVCNSLAVLELRERGLAVFQGWIELEKRALEELAEHSVLPMEQYRYGRPVLLTTRASVAVHGRTTDAKGEVFRILPEDGLTRLYAEKIFSVPPVRGAAGGFYDLRYADPGEKPTGDFNFSHELK